MPKINEHTLRVAGLRADMSKRPVLSRPSEAVLAYILADTNSRKVCQEPLLKTLVRVTCGNSSRCTYPAAKSIRAVSTQFPPQPMRSQRSGFIQEPEQVNNGDRKDKQNTGAKKTVRRPSARHRDSRQRTEKPQKEKFEPVPDCESHYRMRPICQERAGPCPVRMMKSTPRATRMMSSPPSRYLPALHPHRATLNGSKTDCNQRVQRSKLHLHFNFQLHLQRGAASACKRLQSKVNVRVQVKEIAKSLKQFCSRLGRHADARPDE